jgi:hypothetical protein
MSDPKNYAVGWICTQAKQAQDNTQSATDAVQNPSPDENLLANAPDLRWEELWTRARDKLATDKHDLVEEYLFNLAKRPEFQSSGQSDGFTINSESVMSIVMHLDKERTDKQWCLKWKTDYFDFDINLRKQIQKLVKVAMWSDKLVKEALSTQPHAALAWSGATMVLPVGSQFSNTS